LGKAETESDMSNQEMQFADPDWKPSQKLDAKTGTQEQETFIPEPINADSRGRWNTPPPPPPRQEMYTGLPPYAGATPQQPVRGQYRQGPYRRGGRGIWFWVILAFIIISLMGGGFGSVFRSVDRFGGPPFNGSQSSSIESPHFFKVSSSTPTVVITGDNGTINVQTSSDANTVTIQDTGNPGFSGNPNDTQVNYSQSADGNTINASGQGSVDFTVTVPQGADLQLNTSSGDISFNGTIGTGGTDQFTTSSGTIDLTVSPDSAFHLKASTNSGTINTPDFPSVKQTNNQAGIQATGNVGTASQGQGATVTLNTDSGDINLNQGP
jgi:hypothetical protein